MRASSRRLWILALFGAALSGGVRGQVVTLFPLPTGSGRPGSIAAGPDGNLWFTEESANKVGRITTAGVVTEFGEAPGGPSVIVAGPDGGLWFNQYYDSYIGRITTGGTITGFAIPSIASGMTSGPGRSVWFTEPYTNRIGRISTGGMVNQFTIPFECNPTAIAAGADGNLWFTGELGNQIGRVTPSGTFTRFAIPTANSGPAGIAAGPDGNLWFTEKSAAQVGRITTGGAITEFPIPPGRHPDAVVAGGDGSLWLTFVGHGYVGRMTTAGEYTDVSIAPLAGVVGGIAAGRDGNIWVTESSGKIGRIAPGQAPPPSCLADATTLCLGGRFQVRAEWQVPSQATSGQGRAVRVTDDTGTFWFFEASSVEVIVKVLDACSSSGHSWVFAGGLTNVGVTVTVTDTQTDETKTYTNAAGNPFQPIQDTAAFSTCP